MGQKVLFICTGNYYRSRFAEMLFNALATKTDLGWTANSRGLEPGMYHAGPVYPLVLKRLEALGVPMKSKIRAPIRLEASDLEKADLIIALDEAEHRPLVTQLFLPWAERILYWNIPDLHLMSAEQAFSQIEKEITALIRQLENQSLP